MSDTLSLIEQRAWQSASSLGPLAGDPIPAYCDAISNYYNRITEVEEVQADSDLVQVRSDIYAELNEFQIRTLVEAGILIFEDDESLEEKPPKEEPDEFDLSEAIFQIDNYSDEDD